MTNDKIADYRGALEAIVLAHRVLRMHDFDQLLRDIEHADAVGPLLDPTLWMQKHKAMAEDAQLIRAAAAFVGKLAPLELAYQKQIAEREKYGPTVIPVEGFKP